MKLKTLFVITTMKYASISIAKCLQDLCVWEKLQTDDCYQRME